MDVKKYDKAASIRKKIDYYRSLIKYINSSNKSQVVINYCDKDGSNAFDEYIPKEMNQELEELWSLRIEQLQREFEEL